MDPNTTLRNIESYSVNFMTQQEAAEYCSYLQEWLNKGGSQPNWYRYPRGEGFFLCWQYMTSLDKGN